MNEKMKQNAGATLVELMVYMIVALLVITATFQVISRAIGGYAHGRAVSKAQFNARDAINAMGRDIASMGYKIHFNTENPPKMETETEFGTTKRWTSANLTRLADALTTPESDAAFFFDAGVLQFFRIALNPNGNGTISHRERIHYRLNNNNEIIRERYVWRDTPVAWNNPTTGANPETIVIASNVVALHFRFSSNGIDWHPNFTTIRRDQVRHIEISLVTRSHRRGEVAASSYEIYPGLTYSPPFPPEGTIDFRKHIHRVYRQTVEVPNNAR